MKKLLALILLLFSINGFVEDNPDSFYLECRDEWSFFGKPKFHMLVDFTSYNSILDLTYVPLDRSQIKEIRFLYNGIYKDNYIFVRKRTNGREFDFLLNRDTLKITVRTGDAFNFPYHLSTCKKISLNKSLRILDGFQDELENPSYKI
tara:strand:- start:1 stop:444 length:444 start_codon:yes stop_codon:yes gene_type:complete